jgi:hypothetical protein
MKSGGGGLSFRSPTIVIFVLLLSIGMPLVSAHCDTMAGPVVKAGQNALSGKNVNYVLIWVPKEKEPEIITLFEKTLESRKTDQKADMEFFTELVRIHREGEGVEFDGVIKPADAVEPSILAADTAIKTNNFEVLDPYVSEEIHEEAVEHFEYVMALKNFEVADIDAGRKYVHAYVEFTHFIESGGMEHHEEEHEEEHEINHEDIWSSNVLPWSLVVILVIIIFYMKFKK